MNRNEQEYLVQKIRTQYTEQTHIELDELKALDKKVRTPASVFAWVFSALTMGAGMSLIMTDIGQKVGIGEGMMPGLVIGSTGMLMAIVPSTVPC